AQQDVYSAGIAIAFNEHDDRESLDTAELASSRAFLDLLAGRRDTTAPAADAGLTFRGSPSAAGDLRSSATAAPAKADDIVAIARRLHSTAIVYWPADEGLFVWVVNHDGRIVSRKVDVSLPRLIQLVAETSPLESAS